jgi:hypothetical protein
LADSLAGRKPRARKPPPRSGERRKRDVEDTKPAIWCFVAKGYYHPIEMVTLEQAEVYKEQGWLVVGPDPKMLAERVEWRKRTGNLAIDDGA